MSDMYDQYHSACPGLDTKTKGHRHSSHCRKITIISIARPNNEDMLAKAVIALVLQQILSGDFNPLAGRHDVHVDDALAAHIDVTSQAPSSDPALAAPPPPADSDPTGTAEQLQLGL
jgi:hypothetical protein